MDDQLSQRDGGASYAISQRAANLSIIHIAVTVPLLILGLSLFFLRVWLRSVPVWRINLQDYIMAIGVIFAMIDFGFLMQGIYPTPIVISIEEVERVGKCAFIAIIFFALSMACIKISVALLLLSIQPKIAWWRTLCYTIIATLAAWGMGTVILILLLCHPVDKAWRDGGLAEGNGTCMSARSFEIGANVSSAVHIATDLVLSLAPTCFLWKLNRPLREKILIGVLMAMGLLASGASIGRVIMVKDYGRESDAWALYVAIATWTATEQLLVVIAASAPFLKPSVQWVLKRVGVSVLDSGASHSAERQMDSYQGLHRNPENLPSSQDQPAIRKQSLFTRVMMMDNDDEEALRTPRDDVIPLETPPPMYSPTNLPERQAIQEEAMETGNKSHRHSSSDEWSIIKQKL